MSRISWPSQNSQWAAWSRVFAANRIDWFAWLSRPKDKLLFKTTVQQFVTSVRGCKISNKHLVVAKVTHSQRMNDPLVNIWIIADSDETIQSTQCLGCKAGLAESCFHIASVLFYIEAWIRINGKLACTQVKCTWLLPTFVNEVSYARVRNIDFSRRIPSVFANTDPTSRKSDGKRLRKQTHY